MVLKNPHEVVRDRAEFFGKYFFALKNGGMGQ